MSSILSLSLHPFLVRDKGVFLSCSTWYLGQALGEIIATYPVNPTTLRVVRVARVGRVLRLVKGL